MNAFKDIVIVASFCLFAHVVCAERVTIAFEAEAATVTDQPFGMTVPRLTIVRGYMSYETNSADSRPADPMRGNFVLTGTWDFRAEFLGRVITGSGTATASTNLFGAPTLRFEDGKNTAASGIMSIDGVADEEIGLGFAISGEAKDLPTDQLPEKFTFNPPPSGASHTFSLSSSTGTMLLQFRSFAQIPLVITSATLVPGNGQVEVRWASVQGKRYALAHATSLLSPWEIIQDNLTGASVTTTVMDDLAARYPGGPPEIGYYRVLDRGPP